MIYKTMFLALLGLLVIVGLEAGCNQEQTTSQQLENAKTETKAAAQDMKDGFNQSRQWVSDKLAP